MTVERQAPPPRYAEPHQRLYQSIWDNPEFLAQTGDVRNVWRFVLTGPDRVTEGLFRLRVIVAAQLLDLPEQTVRDALDTLDDLEVIIWDADREHCLIVGALAYQGTTNPNGAKGLVNKLATLRNNFLMVRLRECAVRYGEHRLVAALDDHFVRVGINPGEIVETATDSGNTPQQPATPRNTSTTTRTSPSPSPSPYLNHPQYEKEGAPIHERRRTIESELGESAVGGISWLNHATEDDRAQIGELVTKRSEASGDPARSVSRWLREALLARPPADAVQFPVALVGRYLDGYGAPAPDVAETVRCRPGLAEVDEVVGERGGYLKSSAAIDAARALLHEGAA